MHRKVLVDGLERDLVQNNVNVPVFVFEAAEEISHHLALVAIRVPGHPQDSLRLCRANARTPRGRQKTRGQHGRADGPSCDCPHSALPGDTFLA